ncbi:MAG: NUDIX domain-containing protein [Nocardioides sp.]|uniref:NUDIX hydrolase n=1 Tax=Nocardioides sp. TaxID=35761 RepID=UPI0039E5D5FA
MTASDWPDDLLPPFLDEDDARGATEATRAGAMAIVVTPAGVLLHLRDDKPWIPHPGCWSLFGGAVEEGESPEVTVVRELAEELGLSGVECKAMWRVVDREGDGRLLTIFEATTDRDREDMILTEGQAAQVFDIEVALSLKLAPFCRRVLEGYADPMAATGQLS